MTPIKLKMQAFGAYVKPVTLDFENGLRDERIFLIHGATGAGKTTILDAISYALYGETSGKARKGEDMRSKNAAADVATEVEFTFKLGGKIFTVRRTPAQDIPKKRGEGFKTVPASAELYCDKNLIETKSDNVTKKIVDLIGFKAEQFRQVVLLPQGEFKKFLAADSDKRQEVLNILFDSTPYREVENALGERARNSADEVKTLENQREILKRQLQGTDNESLAEVETKLLAAQKKSDELKKISEEAQTRLTNGRITAEKFADLKRKLSALDAAQIQLAEAEKKFSEAQTEYQLRESEETLRKNVEHTVEDLKKIKSMLDELAEREKNLDTAQSNLQAATKAFETCERKTKTFETRLDELKAKRAPIVGAGAKFERAKHILEQATELKKILQDISRLEKVLEMEREKLSVIDKNFQAVQIELERLQIVNQAAHLAMRLVDGEPCPVCGSREHPAITQAAIPTAVEIQTAEKKLERLTKEKSLQERNIARLEENLSSQKNRLNNFVGVPNVATATKNRDDARKAAEELDYCEEHIRTGEEFIRKNDAALNTARQARDSAKATFERLTGTIDGMKTKIPEIYLANRKQLETDLSAAQSESKNLNDAWTLAQKNFHDADRDKSARNETVKNLQRDCAVLQSQLKEKTSPDIPALEQIATDAKKNSDAANDERAKLENTLGTLKKFSAELAAVNKKIDATQKIADMWRRLSDVANATGRGESELKISFQRYFLSTMFGDVVEEANNRLKKMSGGRYLFQMKDAGSTKAKSAGLNLQIFDEYTGALRPVETLSGGESFLASLSLALGLASVVKNKVGGIKLDTIFIDEGFGSLDSETLDDAISTIVAQSGGRLVGIISHVEELKNQIPVRLEVIKGKTGSVAKFSGQVSESGVSD